MEKIVNIKEELLSRELFLFDLDGTVYIGDKEIEGAFSAIEYLRSIGKKICFLTNNSSRSLEDYLIKLKKMGFQTSKEEMFSSGMATAEYISLNYPGKSVFVLGTSALMYEFYKAEIPIDEEEPDIVVLGFDTNLMYHRLYKACRFLRDRKLYIATHPDINCPNPLGPMPDIGAIMKLIEASVERTPDVICGKPYAPMAESIQRHFSISADKIAMIGDRLYTDIRFGNDNGFLSILVMSGETTEEMLLNKTFVPDIKLSCVRDIEKVLKED